MIFKKQVYLTNEARHQRLKIDYIMNGLWDLPNTYQERPHRLNRVTLMCPVEQHIQ